MEWPILGTFITIQNFYMSAAKAKKYVKCIHYNPNKSRYISACRRNINKIPTRIPVLGSNNPLELVGILCDQPGSGKAKMAAT